jgi:hypothetical protein
MKTFRPTGGGFIKEETTEGIDVPRLPAHTVNAFS